MAIQATDGGKAPVSPLEQARQLLKAAQKAVTQTPGNGPDAKAAQKALAAAQANYDAAKQVSVDTNPDVMAARGLQTAAAAEVANTDRSIADAYTNLSNLYGESPTPQLTSEGLAAIQGLDTNLGLLGGAGTVAGPKGSTGATGTGTATATTATATTYTGATGFTPLTAVDNSGRQSAYDTLYNEFNKYGLGSLVEAIKGMITDAAVSPSQLSIALQNTKEYQQRFSANQDRIKAGLRALSPAEYIGLEDQYQNIMRNYGLPSSYYSKDTLGTQSGFNKLLSNDVSAAELEDRIATAQQRVQNSNPEVLRALKQFYPDISNGDILSYALDPQNALTNIKRKVTAAEIGGAALAQGLQAQGGTAESLAGLGITKAQAQQGYTDIAGILPRGSQLADIYKQQPYTQGTAEAEVFNTAGAADAAAKRKKLIDLEKATFAGSSGVGALGRDKGLYGAAFGQQGQY